MYGTTTANRLRAGQRQKEGDFSSLRVVFLHLPCRKIVEYRIALGARSINDTASQPASPTYEDHSANLAQKLMKGQEGTNIAHYGKAGFKRIARAVNVMPIGVLGLYLIKSPLTRLAAIVGFSAAFLLALALFTKARLVEVFAATTA